MPDSIILSIAGAIIGVVAALIIIPAIRERRRRKRLARGGYVSHPYTPYNTATFGDAHCNYIPTSSVKREPDEAERKRDGEISAVWFNLPVVETVEVVEAVAEAVVDAISNSSDSSSSSDTGSGGDFSGGGAGGDW